MDFILRVYFRTPKLVEYESIPFAGTAKYLGIKLDAKLTWKSHLTVKKDELNARFHSMFSILRYSNKLSLANHRLLYVMTIQPV